jgi:carbamoyl-phosphate synthase large subunit
MTLPKIKVLLTAVGCPGGVTMIRALKSVQEREIEIVGVDMQAAVAGRFFVDGFFQVPAGHSADYVPRLMEIVEHEKPDVLFPQSSYEVYPISLHRQEFESRGVRVLVASPQAIELSNDKGRMYARLSGNDVPFPDLKLAHDSESFVEAVHSLGYPERVVCFKPAIGKGSRGFRIISAMSDRVDMLINRRIDETTMALDEVVSVLRQARPFPSLVVSEFVEGKEHTVDVFCRNGRVLTGFVKTREAIKAGLAMYFEQAQRPDLWRYGLEVARALGLDYFANIQFKGGKLLEVNPRVSTFIHQRNFNMPYLGIKYALGEIDETELKSAGDQIRPTRRSVRYYDQVFCDEPGAQE